MCALCVWVSARQYWELPAAVVTTAIAPSPNPDGSINITVSTSGVAAFVTLTTRAAGRFSDNAFVLVPPSAVITFLPFGPLDLSTLTASLRSEHVAMYQ